jgi:hypothetical protein
MLDARLPSIESTPSAPAAMDTSVRPSRQEAEAAVRTFAQVLWRRDILAALAFPSGNLAPTRASDG